MTTFAGKFIVPAALAVIAAWRISGIWTDPPLPSEPVRQPENPIIKADLPSALSFHWNRPLFNKPPLTGPDPISLSKPTEDNLPQFPRLVGVIADGENRIAVLELKGRLVRSQKGLTVGSWKIVNIEPRSVTLENSAGATILDLGTKPLSK